ncbi:MAG: hypothetical protein ACQ9CV_03550 [Nitrosopumilus sp.]
MTCKNCDADCMEKFCSKDCQEKYNQKIHQRVKDAVDNEPLHSENMTKSD